MEPNLKTVKAQNYGTDVKQMNGKYLRSFKEKGVLWSIFLVYNKNTT